MFSGGESKEEDEKEEIRKFRHGKLSKHVFQM